jgi:hypothetical protein
MKQAYTLKLFQQSEEWKHVLPSPENKTPKVYIPRKGWRSD